MTTVPFRSGLMSLDPFGLVGAKCSTCSEVSFPARSVCPACRVADTLKPMSLTGSGVVYTFTIVRQAPPGVAVPYALAYVDLPEGVRVLAQVDVDDPAEMFIGMHVKLSERPMGTSDAGDLLIGYQFAPATKAEVANA